jgi:hypothetical protein
MRREFPKPVKVAVVKRAKRGNVVYCEGCGLPTKDWRIDHKRADGLLGEPTLENAQLLGKCCYAEKDAADTRAIAKAKRREAVDLGVKGRKGLEIQSRGFAKKDRKHAGRSQQIDGRSEIARRFGLKD